MAEHVVFTIKQRKKSDIKIRKRDRKKHGTTYDKMTTQSLHHAGANVAVVAAAIGTPAAPITTIDNLLESFAGNKNTGNKYEIAAIIHILVDNGLDEKKNIPPDRSSDLEKLRANLNNEKKYVFPGLQGIRNLTQNDAVGGTGDVELVFADRSEYWSITQYKKNLEKCMHNAGRGMYNIVIDEALKKENEIAFENSKKWKQDKHGPISKKWKKGRDKIPFVTTLNEKIAQRAAENWIEFTVEEQVDKVKQIMDVDDDGNPKTKGIIFASANDGIKTMYTWTRKVEDMTKCVSVINEAALKRPGGKIYVYHYITGTDWKKTWFIRTQIKHNNGIIHYGKKPRPEDPKDWKLKAAAPCSSLDCVGKLDNLFHMVQLYK